MIPFERYARHFSLEGFSAESQKMLLKSKVLVAGCGGLGSPVISYLVSAGIGHITLCDGDRVSLSNLNRQFLYRECDVGRYKAERAAEFIKESSSSTSIIIFNERLMSSNYGKMIKDIDLIIDCTDGLTTKYFINDLSVITGIPLVHGAVSSYEGQLMTITKEHACLRCVFPEIPPKASIPTCSQVGILGASCGIIGSLMALEAVKFLIDKEYKAEFSGKFTSLDLYKPTMKSFEVSKNPECPICGSNPSVDPNFQNDYVL